MYAKHLIAILSFVTACGVDSETSAVAFGCTTDAPCDDGPSEGRPDGGEDSGEIDQLLPCVEDRGDTKCAAENGAPGWCEAWDWPDGKYPNSYYCKACIEITGPGCDDVPGCSPVGSACQGEAGTGGCPPQCCPLCY
jgi:hypothetical protein